MSANEAIKVIANRIGVPGLQIKAAGPSKPYGDSEYEWELVTKEDIDEAELLAFCQRLLRKNTQTYEEWRKGHNEIATNYFRSASIYFRGYYTLVKRTADTWIYRVVEPYCD